MNKRHSSTLAIASLIAVAALAGAYFMGRSDERAGRPSPLESSADAAPKISPKKARARDFYAPNSED